MQTQDNVLIQLLRSADVVTDPNSPMSKEFDGESYPKLPEPESLELGEVALNLARGFEVIAIKNDAGEIVYLPFNIALRLAAAESEIEDVNNYAIRSFNSLSDQFITVYNTIDDFRYDVTNRFLEVYGNISSLSSSTEDKFVNVYNEINNIDNQITVISAATTQVSSATTEYVNERISAVEGDLINLSNDVHALSSETKFDVNILKNNLINTNYRIEDVASDVDTAFDAIAAISASTLDVSSATTEYVDEKIAEVNNKIYILNSDFSTFSSETIWTIESLNESLHYSNLKIYDLEDGLEKAFDDIEILSAVTLSISSASTAYVNAKISDVRAEISSLRSDMYLFEDSINNVVNDIYSDVSEANYSIRSVSAHLMSEIEYSTSILTGMIDDVSIQANSRITELSGHTDSELNRIEGKFYTLTLSGLSDVNIVPSYLLDNEIEILSKEDGYWMNRTIGLATQNKYGLVKAGSGIDISRGVISAQKIEIDQAVVRGSEKPVAGGAVYDTTSQLEQDVRYVTEQELLLEYYTSDLNHKFHVFSGETRETLDELLDVVSSYTDVRQGIEDIELVHAGAFGEFRKALGLNENAQYTPQYEPLSGFNMTEAIDYIGSNINGIAEETDDVRSAIIENEMVHAAAFARLNHSLGFNVNGEYQPTKEDISGMNVTEAVDFLCDGYDEILSYINIQQKTNQLHQVTYESLGILINNMQLIPGALYRIQNYQTTLNAVAKLNFTTRIPVRPSDYLTNMGFDVIVLATSEYKLNENAFAIKSYREGYFEDNYLNGWRLKYCYKNDTARFDWADENGFGVIYYMEDEVGNSAPYDFKNILNKFDDGNYFTYHDSYNNTDASTTGMAVGNAVKPFYNTFTTQRLPHVSFICNSNLGDRINGNFVASGANNLKIKGSFFNCMVADTKYNTTINGPRRSALIGYSIVE